MKPQDQEFVNIEGVQYGDCMRATIASVLELPIIDVPHFLRDADGVAKDFWNRVYDFAEGRGYDFRILHGRHDIELAQSTDGYHLIGGPSPRGRGLHHSVVGKDGQIVFDPHPSREGLLGGPSEWCFEYLVKHG